jgi:protein involved in polysaccharide export with SLBB domain/translation initiation factor IF-1
MNLSWMDAAAKTKPFAACQATCLVLIACMTQTGCVTNTFHAVPACRLPAAFQGPTRSALEPVDLALLRQDPPPAHIVGPGDLLGVFVHGVIPPQVEQTPVLHQNALRGDYYPPRGSTLAPTTGLPMEVQSDGMLALPLIGCVPVQGLTIPEVTHLIREAYEKREFLQPGRERVYVTLIRPRVHRVLVIREDSRTDTPTLIRKETVVYTKRGFAEVVDLPAFENDVLHALTASGGLPGIDAWNRVILFRGRGPSPRDLEAARDVANAAENPEDILPQLESDYEKICIPLRALPCDPLPFSRDDIILHNGDIVYLEPRDTDFFYTGGLLTGGQVPLPRDRDIDVVEAIALANGSVGGPGGTSGVTLVRAVSGPGNIIPPTRVLILRKLPNDQQLAIRVDLNRAMRHERERIKILPRDVVMLQYKPGEIATNVALNFFNFNILLDPKEW